MDTIEQEVGQEPIEVTRKPEKKKREITDKQRQQLEKMRQMKAIKKEATKLVRQTPQSDSVSEAKGNVDNTLFLVLVGVGAVGIGGMYYMQQKQQNLFQSKASTPLPCAPVLQMQPVQSVQSVESSPQPKKEQNKYSQLQLAF